MASKRAAQQVPCGELRKQPGRESSAWAASALVWSGWLGASGARYKQ
jgi:hypothetical protein